MPIYEYRCEACGERFEEYLNASTAPPPPCTACGSDKVERLWSSFGTEWKPSIVNWHRVGSSWGAKPPKKNF
jgi:putative FmdB family regulatory protein